MALLFGAASTDLVEFGSLASLDNLLTFTYITWLYPTTLTVGNRIYSKDAGGDDRAFIELHWGNSDAILASVGWSVGSDESDSSAGVLTTNAWQCVAVTYDHAGAGNRIRIYKGTLSSLLSEVSYQFNANTGSGTHDDSTANLIIGNKTAPRKVFQGRIANACVWNRVLTLGEMIQQQFSPHPTSGCVLFSQLGYNGTGTQPDWSGNINNGTVTGATVADHVPLAPFPAVGSDQEWSGAFTSLVAVAQALLSPYEALLSSSSPRISNFESLIQLQQQRVSIYESLLSLLQQQTSNFESLIQLQQQRVSIYESLLSLLQQQTSNFESLVTALSSRVSNYEALISLSQSRAVNFESLQHILQTAIMNFESLAAAGAVSQTGISNYEALGYLAPARAAAFEALQSLLVAKTSNFEALAIALRALGSQFEALAKVSPTAQSNFESRGYISAGREGNFESLVALTRSLAAQFEALQSVHASGSTPYWFDYNSAVHTLVLSAVSVIMALSTQNASVIQALLAENAKVVAALSPSALSAGSSLAAGGAGGGA